MSILEKAKTYVGVYADTDIRGKLKSDHEAIRDLAKGACEESTPAKRTESFKLLKPFLTAHARAEEAVVYTALVKKRRSPDSRDYGNEGFVEHGVVDDLMAQIASTRPAGSDMWKARAKVLYEMLKHHIDEEEKNIFEELGEHFDDAQREKMATEFESRKEQLMSGARDRATATGRTARSTSGTKKNSTRATGRPSARTSARGASSQRH